MKPIRDENGLAVDFEIDGEYPQYGNNDERVDSIACDLVERFMKKIKALPTYRNAVPTQSILTITSNVVYGRKPVTRQTVVVRVHRSHRALTRCTVVTAKVR